MLNTPGSCSVTRNVTAIEVPKNMESIYQSGKVYLIDTPGFKDTSGSTIDLCNSYGTSNAIKNLK